MSVYQHILLTTDLTESSQQLADKAHALAMALEAKLSIIHVIESNPSIYGLGEFATPLNLEIEEKLYKKAQQALEKQAHDLNIPQQQQWLMLGAKLEELINVVRKQQVDLILVGAHNKQGIELFFSSTAGELLRALPCDVSAIKVG